jgi:hypothetical protein
MPEPGTEEIMRAEDIGVAVELAIAEDPKGRPRDALCAFVLAWKRQWPRTFARVFGDTAETTQAWAEAAIDDPNRHIKLSRIAMAHLAKIL